jgi:excisionase family DNA binding protein
MLHTVNEVAEQLRVSPRTIHNLVKRGDITPTRIGDRLLFHADEVDRFAKEGVRSISTKPIDRQELNSYIESVEGHLKFVLESLAAALDGKAFDLALADSTAVRLAVPLLQIIEMKTANRQTRTDGERLAVRYLGLALSKFMEQAG